MYIATSINEQQSEDEEDHTTFEDHNQDWGEESLRHCHTPLIYCWHTHSSNPCTFRGSHPTSIYSRNNPTKNNRWFIYQQVRSCPILLCGHALES
jgi:hypothetical protein